MLSRTFTYEGVCCSDLMNFHLSVVDENDDINILEILKDIMHLVIKVEYPSPSDQEDDDEWYEEPNSSLTIYVQKENSKKFKNYIETIGFKLI